MNTFPVLLEKTENMQYKEIKSGAAEPPTTIRRSTCSTRQVNNNLRIMSINNLWRGGRARQWRQAYDLIDPSGHPGFKSQSLANGIKEGWKGGRDVWD